MVSGEHVKPQGTMMRCRIVKRRASVVGAERVDSQDGERNGKL